MGGKVYMIYTVCIPHCNSSSFFALHESHICLMQILAFFYQFYIFKFFVFFVLKEIFKWWICWRAEKWKNVLVTVDFVVFLFMFFLWFLTFRSLKRCFRVKHKIQTRTFWVSIVELLLIETERWKPGSKDNF